AKPVQQQPAPAGLPVAAGRRAAEGEPGGGGTDPRELAGAGGAGRSAGRPDVRLGYLSGGGGPDGSRRGAQPAPQALGLQPLAAACTGDVAAAAERSGAAGSGRTGASAAVDSRLRGGPAAAAAAAQQYPAGRAGGMGEGVSGRAGDLRAEPGSRPDRVDRLQSALW